MVSLLLSAFQLQMATPKSQSFNALRLLEYQPVSVGASLANTCLFVVVVCAAAWGTFCACVCACPGCERGLMPCRFLHAAQAAAAAAAWESQGSQGCRQTQCVMSYDVAIARVSGCRDSTVATTPLDRRQQDRHRRRLSTGLKTTQDKQIYACAIDHRPYKQCACVQNSDKILATCRQHSSERDDPCQMATDDTLNQRQTVLLLKS